MFDLTGKVALVTGASGGIGRATAIALSQQGATLILTGRREAALQETAAACSTPCHIFTADLGRSQRAKPKCSPMPKRQRDRSIFW